jgi:uncharacterized protein
MNQQAAFGDYIFSIHQDTAFESWTRNSDGGFVGIERAGRYPATQQVGQGLDTLTLQGEIIGIGGSNSLDSLRVLQSRKKPQPLVLGDGSVLGEWKLMRVTERRSRVLDDGKNLVTEFTLELEKYEQ